MKNENLVNESNLIILKSLCKKYKNNFELGEQVRKLFRSDSFVLSLPNDQELGDEIRKIVISL
jgi:hypothetical protein